MQEATCLQKQDLAVIQTIWVVICGCPSSGKSTLTQALKQEGFDVEPEYAREYYVDLGQAFIRRGLDIKDVRAEGNIPHNQELIYRHRVHTARNSDPEKTIIFDTGIPESYIRIRNYAEKGLEIDPRLIAEAQKESERYRYHRIFHLEPLDFVPDGIRIEDPQEIATLDKLTKQIYEELGYDVITVPKFSPDIRQSVEDRLEFIKSCIVGL